MNESLPDDLDIQPQKDKVKINFTTTYRTLLMGILAIISAYEYRNTDKNEQALVILNEMRDDLKSTQQSMKLLSNSVAEIKGSTHENDVRITYLEKDLESTQKQLDNLEYTYYNINRNRLGP